MNRLFLYLQFLLMLCLVGCTDELFDYDPCVPEGEPVELCLSFGANRSSDAVVTRQTMPLLSDEAKVWNIYVFVFDSDGKKIYGHYFDENNRKANTDNLDANSWQVTIPEGDSEKCEGVIKIKTVSKPGCSIYAVANLDNKMFNLSPEMFELVQDVDELQTIVVSLNQQLVERSGVFPMTGLLENVNTGADINDTLHLVRLDAKVRFWIKTGESSGIESFELENWQVFNVPENSYLLPRNNRAYANDAPGSYFNSVTKNLEDTELVDGGNSRYGFSFYMLENNMPYKKKPTQYNDRERQNKDADGLNGDWEFANDNSTYVVLTGRIVMNTESMDDVIGAILSANVRYVIHLGDFSQDVSNFATVRNTSYTYNVTINGVNDIRVEVKSSADDPDAVIENSPGATGDVTIALDEIINCDAHYATHVLTFNVDNVNTENVTWYVSTPFGSGSPIHSNGVDITSGLDFKWVEFRVNNMEGDEYSKKRQLYIPHHTKRDKDGNAYASSDKKTMYVDELVSYLKEQRAAYSVNPANSDFDKNGNLYITAFINEFYYEEHPITGVKSDVLWKQFINQDKMRVMHILSDSKYSFDKESSEVGSTFTIQQRSIQSIYNHNHPELKSAWGVEHFDEHPNLPYNSVGYSIAKQEDRGNNYDYNGRINTLLELGLANKEAINTFITGKKWSDFLNLDAESEEDVMKPEYNYLQYTCLSRNRDNNGDGYIDVDEIRWYVPAIRQLAGLWIGADGVQNSARMYKRTAEQKASNDPMQWRQHVVSSSMGQNEGGNYNSNNPKLIWAEEGASVGTIDNSHKWSGINGQYTGFESWDLICVRDLGLDNVKDLVTAPQDYVRIEGTNEKPIFDLTYLNRKSIRYRIEDGVDLVYSDEYSIQNKVYWRFEATSVDCPTYEAITFQNMQKEINNSLANNRFCPKGYRLPNQREICLMHLYCSYSFWNGSNNAFSRTYYSFGAEGNKKETGKYGWIGSHTQIYMSAGESSTQLRAVRDLDL